MPSEGPGGRTRRSPDDAGRDSRHAAWIVWQFDRPDLGEGMVQAFRREASQYESARFKLGGLEPAARYALTDLDGGGTTEATGRELAETGLAVGIKGQPGSAVVMYKRVK